MSAARSGCFMFGMVVVGACTPTSAGPPSMEGPSVHSRLLVQSELDLFPAAKRLVTLQFDKASPEALLEMLRKESGLTIEVQGKLPVGPKLSASFRDTEVRDAFTWFSKQLRVTYRAEPPKKLWVITESSGERPHAKEAS